MNEPVKPKPKYKLHESAAPLDLAPEEEEEVEYLPGKDRKHDQEKGGRGLSKGSAVHDFNRLSMAHALLYTDPASLPTSNSSSNGSAKQRGPIKVIHAPDEDDDEGDDDDAPAKPNKSSKNTNGKRPKKSPATPSSSTATSFSASATSSSGPATSSPYPLLTMSEWPGQAEGEGMDLDHFWKVAAASFPEDHSPEVSDNSYAASIIVILLLIVSIFYLCSG